MTIRMNFIYPHRCVCCNRTIVYKHALNEGIEEYDLHPHIARINDNKNFIREGLEIGKKAQKFKKQFKKWWRDKRIQFRCCKCRNIYSNDYIICRAKIQYKAAQLMKEVDEAYNDCLNNKTPIY